MRRMYRRADAVLTYGEHVSRYVAQRRGSDRNVFVAPQAVEADLFGREVDQAERAAWRDSAGIPQDAPLVLYVGPPRPREGRRDAARRVGGRPARRGGPVPGRRGPAARPARGAERGLRRSRGAVRAARRLRGRRRRRGAVARHPVVPRAVGTGLQRGHAPGPSRDRHDCRRRGGGRAWCATARPAWSCPTATRPRSRARSAACSGTRELRERLGAAGRAAVADFSHEAAADAFGKALRAVGAGGESPRTRP